MADVGDLPKFVMLLVMVSLLVGVGAISFIAMGNSARNTNLAVNESHKFTHNGTGTALTYPEVQSWVRLQNRTGYTFTRVTDYNVTIGDSETRVIVKGTLDGRTLNATYYYYSDSTATTAMDNVTTAVVAVSNSWFALLVLIFVLAIILGLVLKAFSPYSR